MAKNVKRPQATKSRESNAKSKYRESRFEKPVGYKRVTKSNQNWK